MAGPGGPRRRLAVVLRHAAASTGGGAEPEEARRANVPIFVLQPELPASESAFHIYEPRYRLLLQHCLERPGPAGQRGEFGMCWPVAPGAFSDVGTLLRVTSRTTLPDGRSDIRCVGIRRFRVLARGRMVALEASTRSQAEYPTAEIEWMEDEDGAEAPAPEDGAETPAPEAASAELEEEAEEPGPGLRMQLVQLHDGLLRHYPAAVARLLLLRIHGPEAYKELAASLDAGRSVRAVIDAPADEGEFVWWCLGLVTSVVRLPQRLKAAVVSSRSAAKRRTLASDVLGRVLAALTEAEDTGLGGVEGEASA